MSDDSLVTLTETAEYLTSIGWGRMSIRDLRFGACTWVLSTREFTYLRWAQRALSIIARISEGQARSPDVDKCKELFDQLVESNSDLPDGESPTMTMSTDEVVLFRRAALLVTEFEIAKRVEESNDARQSKWKGRRRG